MTSLTLSDLPLFNTFTVRQGAAVKLEILELEELTNLTKVNIINSEFEQLREIRMRSKEYPLRLLLLSLRFLDLPALEEFIINGQSSISSLSINNVHSLQTLLLEGSLGFSIDSLSFSNLRVSSSLQIGELNSYQNTLPNVQLVEIHEGCSIDHLAIGKGMFGEVEELKMRGNQTQTIEIGDEVLNKIEDIEIGRK